MCEVRKLKGKTLVQNLRRQSFQVAGPKLWNCLPKNVRNFRGNQVDFKQTLDQFLSKQSKADLIFFFGVDEV